jgi:hypothetical protein
MRRITIAIMLALTLCSVAFSADFLTSARGGGMGFSYFLIADDPSGALYNPSGLGYIRGWQTQLMYEKMPGYGYSTSAEKPYFGQFGVLYYRPDAGTFALNSLQSGSFAQKTAIATINHIILSYGREVGRSFSAGASMKYLYETAFGKRSAFDMDLGVSYHSDLGIAASAVIENIMRAELTPTYHGLTENLPRRTRLGAGYFYGTKDFEAGLLLGGQMEESGISQKYTTSLINVGTEWWFLPQHKFSIGARGGYTTGKAIRNDVKTDYTGPTAGLSLNYKIKSNNIRLDYAWQSYPFETVDGSTPASHFVALTLGWGGVPNYPTGKSHVAIPQIQPEKKEIAKAPDKLKEFVETESPTPEKHPDFAKSDMLEFPVEMDVNNISSLDMTRIVFYVRPEKVIKTVSWKLFIFKARMKSWDEAEAKRWAVHSIEGKGVPPINIVWDGTTKDGSLLPKGKYSYILTATDTKGQNYATNWFTFKIE